MHWKLNLSIKVKIDVESSYKIKLDRFDGLEKKKRKNGTSIKLLPSMGKIWSVRKLYSIPKSSL